MKKSFKNAMLLAFVIFAAVACKYDDGELWDKVNSLDQRLNNVESKLSQINSDISSLSTVVNALQNHVYVKSVDDVENGYQITFTDGKVITITNGKDGKDGVNGTDGKDGVNGADGKDGVNGADGKDGVNGADGKDGANGKDGADGKDGKDGKDAPVISVAEFEGKYYWVQIVDDTETWLTDADGNKLPVTGADAVTPIMKVSADGYWMVSYDRGITYEQVLDDNNNPIKAVGQDGAAGPAGATGATGATGPAGATGATGPAGDSFFSGVTVENGILILTLATDGTELRVPLASSQIVSVNGNIDIPDMTGLTVNTLVEESYTDGTNYSANVLQNGTPQLVYVSNNLGDIVMMTRGYTADDLNTMNAESTALALVTMQPTFVIQSEEEYRQIVDIVKNATNFQTLVEEVQNSIDAQQDVFNVDNAALMVALSNVIEELCASNNSQTFAVMSRANVVGINSNPFVVDVVGNQVSIRNKGLVPSYECSVLYGGREVMNEMIEARSSYGFLDMFTRTEDEFQLADPTTFTLTDEGEYYFYFDRSTEKAKEDLTRRLLADALTIIGFDGSDIQYLDLTMNLMRDLAVLATDPSTDLGNVLATVSGWFVQVRLELRAPEAARLLNKVNAIYNAIKGVGNEIARIRWGFEAPYQADFCLCLYNNEISCCTETEIEIHGGNEQNGYPGQKLMLPLEVLVKTTAEDGSSLTHSNYQKIKFEVVSGGGYVEEEVVATNEQTGVAYTYWVLGEEGEQKVKATVIDMALGIEISQPVYFTANLNEAADVTIRLDWHKLSGRTDIDLHVTDPFNEEIAYYHMRSASGGWLDRDDVIGPGPEHVYWSQAPDGVYLVQVHYYGSESQAITSYSVTINAGGETFGPYSGSISYHETVTIGALNMPDAVMTRSNENAKPTFVEMMEVDRTPKSYPKKK